METIHNGISIPSLIWLFLAMFMLHDVEEIIIVESWMKRNYQDLIVRVPKPFAMLLRNYSKMKSSQFAVTVCIEFIIFIPVTYMAAAYGRYELSSKASILEGIRQALSRLLPSSCLIRFICFID